MLGLEYLVDCDDAKSLKEYMVWRSGKTVKEPKKVERGGEMCEQIGNYPFDLSGGCHIMFVYCDLVQNEVL